MGLLSAQCPSSPAPCYVIKILQGGSWVSCSFSSQTHRCEEGGRRLLEPTVTFMVMHTSCQTHQGVYNEQVATAFCMSIIPQYKLN